MTSPRLIEDAGAVRVLFQRLVAFAAKVTVQGPKGRAQVEVLRCDSDALLLGLSEANGLPLGLATEAHVTLGLEDRGVRWEAVVTFRAFTTLEEVSCAEVSLPRSLRCMDSHRFATFVPDEHIPCTFSNARGALLDAQVRGMSPEGVELALRDSRQNIRDHFRMGEEAILDIPLEANVKMVTATRVAYFGDATVGLQFTDKGDKALMNQFRTWLDTQQQLQAQRDREEFELGTRPLRLKGSEHPTVRLLVDKNPLVLVLSEKEEVARRLAEGLGRKFGFAHQNYIKGALLPQMRDLGADEQTWGRIKLILIHNQLLLASPLELTRQLVEKEKCPLPILVAGTEEDAELKTNRAVQAGAVDYVAVEPFRILSVLRKVDETLKLFHGTAP